MHTGPENQKNVLEAQWSKLIQIVLKIQGKGTSINWIRERIWGCRTNCPRKFTIDKKCTKLVLVTKLKKIKKTWFMDFRDLQNFTLFLIFRRDLTEMFTLFVRKRVEVVGLKIQKFVHVEYGLWISLKSSHIKTTLIFFPVKSVEVGILKNKVFDWPKLNWTEAS